MRVGGRSSAAAKDAPRWRRAAAYAARTASKEESPRKARCTESGAGGSAREQPVMTPKVPSVVGIPKVPSVVRSRQSR